MEITKSAIVARYLELETIHNETIQELNTCFGGATASIYSYDPTEKTADKFNKNADFMLRRLNQISTLNKTIKELNDLVEAGALAQVHAYYQQLSDARKGK
jgi:hypothetical protein